MSTEQNKVIVSRVYDELLNQENKSVIDQVFAPDVVIHDPFLGTVSGVDFFRKVLGIFDAAFPGHRVKAHQLIGEGDFVSVLHTHTAKHSGPFMGMAPTGKEVTVNGVDVFRMANGKIAEFWRHDDMAGLLMQLGIISPPAQA